MKLVFIYGPPAAGKLTVAQAVAAQTGFALFHNHLTADPIIALFPAKTDHRDKLMKSLRLNLLSEAAKMKRDVIFTLAYSGAVDDEFVSAIQSAYADNGRRYMFRKALPANRNVVRTYWK